MSRLAWALPFIVVAVLSIYGEQVIARWIVRVGLVLALCSQVVAALRYRVGARALALVFAALFAGIALAVGQYFGAFDQAAMLVGLALFVILEVRVLAMLRTEAARLSAAKQ